MLIRPIVTPYSPEELFRFFKNDADCFLLDSSLIMPELSQYSFLGSLPYATIQTKNGISHICEFGTITQSDKNPFTLLETLLTRYAVESHSTLPFIGGAVGYFSYDTKQYLECIPNISLDDYDIPDLYFGFYDGVIVYDHHQNQTYICGSSDKIIDQIYMKINTPLPPVESFNFLGNLQPDLTYEEYLEKIEKAKEYIVNGDIYEVNLSQRFSAPFPYDGFSLYSQLRKVSPAPFSAYLHLGEAEILSSSPERLLKIEKDSIETRPIKGTRPRGKTLEEDDFYREQLLHCEKDQSELLMIVDLSRNDLSRICQPHTVKVPRLFGLETYATVYHLVSTITGVLKPNLSKLDPVKALFPGGSITGAPKIRSMEIIEQLEPTKRSIYTGSIGYINVNGDMDFNISIRTMILKDETLYFQVGGAITYDSDSHSEYEETLHKAQGMMRALRGESDESRNR